MIPSGRLGNDFLPRCRYLRAYEIWGERFIDLEDGGNLGFGSIEMKFEEFVGDDKNNGFLQARGTWILYTMHDSAEYSRE